MDVSVDIHAERLHCGAELVDLVEQVADGRGGQRTPHQQGCPYCRAALTELTLRWAPLRELADEPVAVPAGLHRAIMTRLRRLAGGDRYASWLAETGSTRVGSWVLTEICRLAARRTPGVLAVGRCDLTLPAAPGTLAVPPTVSATLTLVLRLGPAVDEVAAAVREAVRADLAHYAGMATDRVDIEIDDVRLPGPPESP